MKPRHLSFTLFIVIVLAGCSNVALPVFGEPSAVPSTETITSSPEPTTTPTPLPSLTPTPTLTPSPTVFMTPTQTPINYGLAETGYDIADVRYSYPRADMLVIDFKYRLDERLEGYSSVITLNLPRRCADNSWTRFYYGDPEVQSKTLGLNFITRELTGAGQIVFKMTIEGVCLAEGLEFSIWPLDYPNWPYPDDLYYTEYVRQPFELSRNFPTLNSDAIAVRDFHFEPGDDWSGVLTFDYEISDEIPIQLEEYYFEISDDAGNAACFFSAAGPRITSNSGTYVMEIDLVPPDLPEEMNCWAGRGNFTYSNTRLSVEDDLAVATVFTRPITFTYTFWEHW